METHKSEKQNTDITIARVVGLSLGVAAFYFLFIILPIYAIWNCVLINAISVLRQINLLEATGMFMFVKALGQWGLRLPKDEN